MNQQGKGGGGRPEDRGGEEKKKKTVYAHLSLPHAFSAPHCGQEGFSVLLHFHADGLTREDWTLRGDLLLYLQELIRMQR